MSRWAAWFVSMPVQTKVLRFTSDEHSIDDLPNDGLIFFVAFSDAGRTTAGTLQEFIYLSDNAFSELPFDDGRPIRKAWTDAQTMRGVREEAQ